MAVDYSNWSVDKLNKEIARIQKAIDSQQKRNRKAALAKVVATAKASGFELDELVGGGTPKTPRKARTPSAVGKKKAAKIAPKYRNPTDVNKTWTGRGRQPVWVREYIENGGDISEITIN